MMKRFAFLTALTTLAACSGGGSGGSGGSSTSNLIQASKMACNGAVCLGSGSLSTLSHDDLSINAVSDAVTLYNGFNQTLIPAMNTVIGKIEKGIQAGGATSCSDISTGFNGDVKVDGTTYNAKTGTSSLNYSSSPFTTATMTKSLAARIAGGANFVQADFDCGAESDVSPLVGRLLAQNGSNQLNAWYERGSSTHIRMLMIAKVSGTVYAGWFKTDDGDNYEVILATAGAVYKGSGSRSAGKINFQDNGAGAASCLNSTTGAAETCSYTLPTQTGIPGSLLQSGSNLAWASVDNTTTLLSPSF